MTTSAPEGAKSAGVPGLVFTRDRLAYLIEKRRALCGRLLCGLTFAWIVLSALGPGLPTVLTKWRILPALAVLAVTLAHGLTGGLLTALVCTFQMLLVDPVMGVVSLLLWIVFIIGFTRAAIPWMAVLLAPHLAALGLAGAVPIALGTGRGRKAWLWTTLAFLWCALHAMMFGQRVFGIEAVQAATHALDALPHEWAGLGACLSNLLARLDLPVYRQDVLGFITTHGHWLPLSAQLGLWLVIGLVSGHLYRHRNLKDKVAMDYLKRVDSGGSKRRKRRGGHRGRLELALIVATVLFVVGYLVLGRAFEDIQYGAVRALADTAAAIGLWLVFYVMLEGNAAAGQLSRAARNAQYGEAFRDLPVGEGGRRRDRKQPAPAAATDGKHRTYIDDGATASRGGRPPTAPGARGGVRTKAVKSMYGTTGSIQSDVEAVVFIDIAGSTAMGTKYGDDYALEMKERLRVMVTRHATDEDVAFQKGTGDGFLLTFPEAINAVRAAYGIVTGLRKLNEDIPETRALNLRVGIHMGQVNIDPTGDRIGTAVNFAARIEGAKEEQLMVTADVAQGTVFPTSNRILVSEVIVDELNSLPAFRFHLLGYFEAKGIAGLQKLYELELD